MDPQRDGGVPPKGQVRVLMPGAGRGPLAGLGLGDTFTFSNGGGASEDQPGRVILNSQWFIPRPPLGTSGLLGALERERHSPPIGQGVLGACSP